jgi:predicted esterase
VNHEHFAARRTARYYSIGAEPEATRNLWIVLHGYAQQADRFLRWFEPLADSATRIVAPEALSRFYLETGLDGRHGPVIGATWLTREDRDADIADHVHYLDGLLQRLLVSLSTRPRVTVLGFSQGSVMAARWLVRTHCVPEEVVLWGTPLPRDVSPEALAACRHGRPVTLVGGTSDPFVPAGSIEEEVRLLAQHGGRARAIRFDGGHEIPAPALIRVAGQAGDSVAP